jgi:hypothetical protein
MTVWREYADEKAMINDLVNNGYRITDIRESLDGDTVRFERSLRDKGTEMEELLLLNADARKYLGVVLLGQLRGVPANANSAT